jgi:SNF2 family DNA or RNA helicase
VKRNIFEMLSPGIASQTVLRLLGCEVNSNDTRTVILPCEPIVAANQPASSASKLSTAFTEVQKTIQNVRDDVQRLCMGALPAFQNRKYKAPSSGAEQQRWLSLFVEPTSRGALAASSRSAMEVDGVNEAEHGYYDPRGNLCLRPMPREGVLTSAETETFKKGRTLEYQLASNVVPDSLIALHSKFYQREHASFKLRVMLPLESLRDNRTGAGRGSISIIDCMTENGGRNPSVARGGRSRNRYAVDLFQANFMAKRFQQSRGRMQQLIIASQQAMGVATGALESLIRSVRRAQRESSVSVSAETLKTFSGVLDLTQHPKRRECSQPIGLTITLHSYQLQSLSWMLEQEKRTGGIASHFWCRLRLPHIGTTHDMLAGVSRARFKTAYRFSAAQMKLSTYSGSRPWTGPWPARKGVRPSADIMTRLVKAVETNLLQVMQFKRVDQVPSELKMGILQWIVLSSKDAAAIADLLPNPIVSYPATKKNETAAARKKKEKKLVKHISEAVLMFRLQLRQKHKYVCDIPRALPRAARERGSCNTSNVGSDDQAYIWYCPVTEEISVSPPEPTPIDQWHRGGFLCEEMGMGKTVITLGCILANPAPAFTADEQKILKDPSMGRFLKGELSKAEIKNGKWCLGRKKLPSRSTLVVCALSLVDQWVTEAESKTQGTNALSIYKYYGPSRIRDPQKLAVKADIVVTTYQTLGSDERGNSQKTGAWKNPCASIKWHRIVLDESHGRAATNSVTRLAGQLRWCVTGTPFCTTVEDLQPQLQFLRGSPFASKNMFKQNVSLGGPELLYTLHRLMMRHTIDQRIDGKTLVKLPTKHERVLTVTMTGQERSAYNRLVAAAKEYYLTIPAEKMRSSTLAIMSSMLPLRRACSGGVINVPPGTGASVLQAASAAVGEDRSTWSQSAKNIVESTPACGICNVQPMEDTVITKCGHAFCKDCISSFLAQPMENQCPTCKAVVDPKHGFVPAKQYNAYGGSSSSYGAAASSAAAKETSDAKRQKVAANPYDYTFEAKLRVLLAELRAIRKADATAKALVFTQFKSTLEWLSVQLPKHGLGFRTISGSDSLASRSAALRAFRSDPPTTIFLLSVRAGAVGINLTSASHIFILEPCLNPSLEVQAIGRAYRMGQTREVHVTRLQVHDSIEGRLLALRASGASGKGVEHSKGDGNTAAAAGTQSNVEVDYGSAGSIQSDRLRKKFGKKEFDMLLSVTEADWAAQRAKVVSASQAAAAAAAASTATTGSSASNPPKKKARK